MIGMGISSEWCACDWWYGLIVCCRYLHQLQVPGIGNISSIPKAAPGPGMYCVDTASPNTPTNTQYSHFLQTDMFSALEGDSRQRRGLERACALLKIHGFNHPHNAGNDAHASYYCLYLGAFGLACL